MADNLSMANLRQSAKTNCPKLPVAGWLHIEYMHHIYIYIYLWPPSCKFLYEHLLYHTLYIIYIYICIFIYLKHVLYLVIRCL